MILSFFSRNCSILRSLVNQRLVGTAFLAALLPTVCLAGGPDVVASRIGLTSGGPDTDDFAYYGEVDGIHGFSAGTTSCNIGDAQAEWISGSDAKHPLIAQNMYRLLDGRFEQIGMNWLKHSFCAVNENTCGTCQVTPCATLGVGCADTYWATLNGDVGGLGPRSEVNPQGTIDGGTHTHPYTSPSGTSVIRGKLQIADVDITAGGRNFIEVQYVTHDEESIDRNNNASWREVVLTTNSISGVQAGQSSVHMGEPAIRAWQAIDSGVTIQDIDLQADGRLHLGYKVTDLGNGTWHYEYALHNLTSDRGVSSFSVPLPNGVTVTNTGFHDVDYHSGEPFDNTDWVTNVSASSIEWSSPETFDQNPNTNALRWGSLYNFRFDADTPPDAQVISLGFFKPGTPTSQNVAALGPGEPFTGGPDVVASRIGLTSGGSGSDDFAYYGEVDGIHGFSAGTTSCNIGDKEAEWISGSDAKHPLIAQNMYRLLNGRFEQIGMNWLKHSFCAVNENTCGTCQVTPCATLGVGCADTYWATLNGDVGGLGPRSEVNPQGTIDGGTHTHPYTSPSGTSVIRGKLQIADVDITAGGRNFIEVQYVTHDEESIDRNNNASWREVVLTTNSISGVQAGQSSVHMGEPAIRAWQAIDSGVTIQDIDLQADGRLHLGYKVTDLGNGTWHYEYALHNLTSDRGVSSFSVPLPNGVTVTNTGFHDVDYHSGEPFDNTDWVTNVSASSIEWSSPETFDQNPNTNALRWGSLYNFRFDADTPPDAQVISLGFFKPGTPTSQNVAVLGPGDPFAGSCVTSATPKAPAGPKGVDFAGKKNRYCSFVGGSFGRNEAVRVTFTNLPPPHDALNGVDMWVGEPIGVSENSGSISPVPDVVNYYAATLQCDPLFRDWSDLGPVHIYHQGIVPGGVYTIQLVDSLCSLATDDWFSDPLVATLSAWGDTTGILDLGAEAWLEPDGRVDVTSDTTACLDKFKNSQFAPNKVRCDLEPIVIDHIINITDISLILEAFQGDAYPFAPLPADPCP